MQMLFGAESLERANLELAKGQFKQKFQNMQRNVEAHVANANLIADSAHPSPHAQHGAARISSRLISTTVAPHDGQYGSLWCTRSPSSEILTLVCTAGCRQALHR